MNNEQLTLRHKILTLINKLDKTSLTVSERSCVNVAWWSVYALGTDNKRNSVEAINHSLDKVDVNYTGGNNEHTTKHN